MFILEGADEATNKPTASVHWPYALDAEATEPDLVATCFPAGVKSQLEATAPDAMSIAVILADQDRGTHLVVGPLVSARVSPGQLFPIADIEGEQNISCRMKDLDGDGVDDLIVSIPDGPGSSSLYVMRGVSRTDGKRSPASVGAPQLLLEKIDGRQWEIFQRSEEAHLQVRAGGLDGFINATSGLRIAFTPEGDDQFALSLISQQAFPPGTPLISVFMSDATMAIQEGNDKVVRKKPGRTAAGIAGAQDDGTTYGTLLSSHQLVSPAGIWTAATFFGSAELSENGDALLRFTEPETLVGWLSSTGPFIPVSHPDGGRYGEHTELLAIRCSEEDTCSGFESYVLSIDGEELRVDKLSLVDGSPRVEAATTFALDFGEESQLTVKNVVRFKAGADLSKRTAATDPDDDGDGILTGAIAALVMDDGLVLVKELDKSTPALWQSTSLHESLLDELDLLQNDDLANLETALWVGSLGEKPFIALRGTSFTPDDSREATLLWSVDEGVEVLTDNIIFGDVLGLGHDQLVRLQSADELDADCEAPASPSSSPASPNPPGSPTAS
ncbi:MAG: hypothetical protein ACNA8W_16655 [Bradymonadaceae bacterium]